jgi:hypothetical protein
VLVVYYTTITPANTIRNTNTPMPGATFMAPPVGVGVLTLLVTLAPVPELVPELVPVVVPEIVPGLVALGVGTVSGGVPRLLKLLALEDRILTGPGPVGSTPLADGITEVIVSVRAGLAKVSVMTVVTPTVGTAKVLPDFVPLNVPVIPFVRLDM